MFDGKAFGDEMVEIVKSYVDRVTAPLFAENEALRTRLAAIEARPMPERGEKGDQGLPGKDADPEAMTALVRDEVAKAVAELPAPERGEAGEVGPEGPAGKDADPEAVRSLILEVVEHSVTERVHKAIDALPAPERGEKGDRGECGPEGRPGKDGAGIADLIIDRDGALIASFDDGRMKSLGAVVGRDGADGRDGRDGEKGEAGADGFGIDDFDIVAQPDGRTIDLKFIRGDICHTFELEFPVMIYRGVWNDGQEYSFGDTVTWGGSLWHCQEKTTAKPDSGASWKLAVKKGRDGRDKA